MSPMNYLAFRVLRRLPALAAVLWPLARAGELYQAPPPGTHTRWISPENPTGAKGAGGRLNRGAKGMAFIVVQPGETAVLADIHGAGIINRMWLSGTLQQIGNASTERVREMLAKGAELKPVWVLDVRGDVMNLTEAPPGVHLLLDRPELPPFDDPKHPQGGCNFYRRDDVSATAYFYLDKPENGLPPLAPGEVRIRDLKERVWAKSKAKL